MNKTAAIVVTYNRRELLQRCIGCLKKQTVPADILVIDNASTDGTSCDFENADEQVRYFNTGANLGGAGGFHFGMKKAVQMGYEHLWLLDDDTLPEPTALAAFLSKEEALGGRYGFFSGKTLWKDGSVCTMNIQKEIKWKRLRRYDRACRVQYASFVSLFLKADTVKRMGLPYKEFFVWADDWEYTRRISKKYECYFLPESVAYHWCDSNIGADIVSTAPERIDRFRYMYRNDVVLYRQDGAEGRLYLALRNLLHCIRIIRDGRKVKEKLRLIRTASGEGRLFHPEIEYPEQE